MTLATPIGLTSGAEAPTPDAAGAGHPPRPVAATVVPRLLPSRSAGPQDLEAHRARYGPLPEVSGARLLAEVQAAGLTGRGGAGFPTYRKLAAVAGRRRPVVVGNGAEGEPASHKDKTLLFASPHLVLDGLQLAAAAVSADRAYLYLHPHPALEHIVCRAIADRGVAGVDRVAVDVIVAPPRFLAGEESAVVNRLSGRPALPRFKVPSVLERGVEGAPTLVQNVETLAHLGLIARYGAPWFRGTGAPTEPGSVLVTCHRAGGQVEVRETMPGGRLAELLELASGGAQAVLVGGYHGMWLTAAQAGAVGLSSVELRRFGGRVGAGVLAALPRDRCGVVEVARVARYLAAESAGQCGPCLNGLPRIANALGELAGLRVGPKAEVDLLRWAGLVEGRGACHHPDGTARFVRSGLRVFAAELAEHARRRCTATNRAAFLPVPAGGPDRPEDWT